MPRLKYKKKGKRVNIWIPEKQLKIAADIDNLSSFVQLALDQAPSIMAWAILKQKYPEKYYENKKFEDHIDAFNDIYPKNELTKLRDPEWNKTYRNNQEIW